MYQSKLILILKSLDKKEFKTYRQFVSRQLGGNNSSAEKLLKILSAEHPEFEGKVIERSNLFKKLFPKEKVNPQKLRYVMTDLMKLMEKYLVQKEINYDEYTRSLLLTKAFRRLKLGKYQASGVSDCHNLLEQSARRDSRYYLKKYTIDEDQFRNSNYLPDFDKKEVLQKIMDSLDAFYLTEKLKCICEVINTKNILQVDYNTELFEEIITYLGNRSLDDIPALKIYYTALQILVDIDNEDDFKSLLILLNSHKEIFNPFELYDLYTYARNYCIRKINNRHDEYVNELFELYLNMLENDLIINGRYLSQWDYKNLIVLGSKLKRFDWVEEFMEDYKHRLHPDEAENAYNFNKAAYHFLKKDYNKTIELLQKVQYTTSRYQLDTKVILLKSFYELNDIVPLFSMLESFKVLIRRNKKLSQPYKKSYNAFVKILKKLVRVKLGSKISKEKLLADLQSENVVGESSWLIEKIKDLDKKPVSSISL